MPLPGSTPTVTISFAGLTIFKLKQNPATTKECDVIVVQCPDHELVIDIQAITIDKNGSPRSSRIVRHQLDMKRNIRIEATNPDHSGVVEHVVTGVKFDRDKDMGDPYDCRWLLNIDGEKFGNQKLELKPPAYVSNPRQIGPIISVTNGIFYTEKISDEKFASIPLTSDERRPRFLGRIAYRMAMDITCKDGNESVVLSNEGSSSNMVELKNQPGVRYLINIENVCPPDKESRGGTDFRFLFDAVSNPDKGAVEKFDIQRVVENGGRGRSREVLAGQSDFSLDSEVQACMGGRVGP